MPSFTIVETENYEPLQSEAEDILSESCQQIMTFYPILKDLALKGIEKAILLREHVRNQSEDGDKSIMFKHMYYGKILQNACTIEEFTKLIKKLKKLPKLAREYTRRFNKEIAIDGSDVSPIPVKTEEEASLPVASIGFSFAPDGFDALYNFEQKPMPINLLPNDLTPEDIAEAETEATTSIQRSFDMVSDGPDYARSDMKSYDLLCRVNRQEKIRRLLNKPLISVEDQINLSKEFHYNNDMIQWTKSYEPPYNESYHSYDDGYSSNDSNDFGQ